MWRAGWLVFVLGACGGGSPAQPCQPTAFYLDRDGDGFGDPATVATLCEPPPEFVATAGDCDDGNAEISPDAVERCDGTRDDNCNGSTDEGCACLHGTEQPCPGGDDTGSCDRGVQVCVAGVLQECRDRVEPSAELCNGADDDCDGEVDGEAARAACGAVAHATSATCSGRCVPVCATGFADCNAAYGDGCEADLGVSTATCGACNAPCAAGLACDLGACIQLPRVIRTVPVLAPVKSLVWAPDGGFFAASNVGRRIVLARFDALGALRWQIQDGDPVPADGNGFAEAGSLAVASDGAIYVAGDLVFNNVRIANTVLEHPPGLPNPAELDRAAFLASYDGDGNARWARVTGPISSSGLRPIVDATGIDTTVAVGLPSSNVYRRFSLAGVPGVITTQPIFAQLASARAGFMSAVDAQLDASCNVTPGPDDQLALVAFDAAGQCSARIAATAAFVQAIDVHPTRAGGFVVAGLFGGTLAAGSFTVTAGGDVKGFAMMLAADGSVVWLHDSDADAQHGGTTIATDDRDNVYWSIHTAQRTDLRSFRADGAERWRTTIEPVAARLRTESMAVRGDGTLLLDVIPLASEIHVGTTVIPATTALILQLAGR
ncbi:MAG: putative metal-binding motif-containing protein [Kofleriaceae bacterium]